MQGGGARSDGDGVGHADQLGERRLEICHLDTVHKRRRPQDPLERGPEVVGHRPVHDLQVDEGDAAISVDCSDHAVSRPHSTALGVRSRMRRSSRGVHSCQ